MTDKAPENRGFWNVLSPQAQPPLPVFRAEPFGHGSELWALLGGGLRAFRGGYAHLWVAKRLSTNSSVKTPTYPFWGVSGSTWRYPPGLLMMSVPFPRFS